MRERFNQHAWKECIVAQVSWLKSKAQAKIYICRLISLDTK